MYNCFKHSCFEMRPQYSSLSSSAPAPRVDAVERCLGTFVWHTNESNVQSTAETPGIAAEEDMKGDRVGLISVQL